MKQASRQKSTAKSAYRWIFRAIAFGFLLLVLMFGVVVFAFVRNLTASWTGVGINPFKPIDVAFRPADPTSGSEPGIPETVPDVQVTPIPWDGKSRISILLLGLDYRDWVARKGSPRSDTMILVSVDPITRQVSMLSIPRDLWVEIPGFGHNRINTAYMFGESSRLPGGGPALAMRVVEDLVGVPIQYYAVVDFSAFERLIEEIGGIDVLVRERIKIAPIGRMAFYLDPKAHHLDGAEALAYARVRKASGGDFGRAERQQQVAFAILDKVVGAEMIPTLVAKAPKLYQEVSSGINTNLSLEEMVSLAWLVTSIPKEDYHRGVIAPPNMVGFYTRPDGAQVLRAVTDQIRVLRDQLFVETSAVAP
jgi:LCP family protein required for cell wall assembly